VAGRLFILKTSAKGGFRNFSLLLFPFLTYSTGFILLRRTGGRIYWILRLSIVKSSPFSFLYFQNFQPLVFLCRTALTADDGLSYRVLAGIGIT
jgi:hypothetical protein